jgi:hypothetical protein
MNTIDVTSWDMPFQALFTIINDALERLLERIRLASQQRTFLNHLAGQGAQPLCAPADRRRELCG